MPTDLAVSDPWLVRVLRAMRVIPAQEQDHLAGADFADGQPAPKGYGAKQAMSAYQAFPWVQAAVSAIASDLSRLPIVAQRGRGSDAERVDAHPMLDLMDQPSSRVSGAFFRRQLVTDYALTGYGFALVVGEREPTALLRLHPERSTVVPWRDGQPGAVQYDRGGSVVEYPWERVMWFRTPSWEDDPSGLYGTSAIRTLHNDLQADEAAAKRAAEVANTGRPNGVFSPKHEGDMWTKDQIAVMRGGYDRQFGPGGSRKSGALFLGGGADYTPFGWSPRDMEMTQLRTWVRDATLATFDVPPTRVGIPSANYATAREEAKHYWQGLQGRAAMLDGELTRIARLFPGMDDVRISHDFSGVEALQESRAERVLRVRTWWDMGLTLADAAAFEGFNDLPTSDFEIEGDDAAAMPAAGATADVASTALNGAQIASLLEILSAVSEGSVTTDAAIALIGVAFPTIDEAEARRIVAGAVAAPTLEAKALRVWLRSMVEANGLAPKTAGLRALFFNEDESGEAEPYQAPVTEAERAMVWRGFIDRLHGPAERDMTLIMRRFLKAQSKRIAKRMGAVMGKGVVTRNISEADIARIMAAAEESALMTTAMRSAMRRAIFRAYKEAAKQVGTLGAIEPAAFSEMTTVQLAKLATFMGPATAAAITEIVRQGITDGATIGEMQTALIKSRAFSPERALRVARTETTKAVNGAAVEAYKDAASRGIELTNMWITAGDELVRDAHAELGGQERQPGAMFEVGGAAAQSPGGFGVAELDINCRCSVIAVLKD